MRRASHISFIILAAIVVVNIFGHTAFANGTKSVGKYAEVNGLKMYYEVHGEGQPIVLIHGAFSGIQSSFGKTLPMLAKSRKVIALELQGHSRTADANRPLTVEGMAVDVAALLDHLKLKNVDVYGYSMGGAVALRLAIERPDLVRKLIFQGAAFHAQGTYPGLDEMMAGLKPEFMAGSPWLEEYMKVAPNPNNFPVLVEKIKQMHKENKGATADELRSLKAPVLILIGDSDIATPESAVEMFRFLGGGQMGDMAGLPKSRLAILPGTSHVSILEHPNTVLAMISSFLDAPEQAAK